MAQRQDQLTDLDAFAAKYGVKVPRALPAGMLAPGNIDLVEQSPRVRLENRSMSSPGATIIQEGNEYRLIPTAMGSRWAATEREARSWYTGTGRHLGIFKDGKSALAYLQQLTSDYEAGKHDPGHTTVLDPTTNYRLHFRTQEDADWFRKSANIVPPDVGPMPRVRESRMTRDPLEAGDPGPPTDVRDPATGQMHAFPSAAAADRFRRERKIEESPLEQLARKYGMKVERFKPVPPPDPGLIKVAPEPAIQSRELPSLEILGLEPGKR